MFRSIKNKFKSEDNKRLLSNFLSLTILQGANYILPLITLPYLVRVLGVEYYGLLAFAGVTIAYFGIITDYGFNLTATREISIYRDDKEKVTEIFSSVITIKFLLMLVSFFLLVLLVLSFDKFKTNAFLYFATFGIVVGQVLFPVWFFQGMERMKYVMYLNVLSKLIFTVAIFIFVQEEKDFYIVPILTSLGYLIAGVLSLSLVKREFTIGFKSQKWETLVFYFKKSWYIFIANISNGIYTNSTVFILGLFTNNTIVGYFSAAERIIKIIQSLFAPLFQALYPYFSKKASVSKKEMLLISKKILYIVSTIALFVSLVLFISAPFVVNIVLGKEFHESIQIIQILSILPLTYVISNFLGTQIMLTNGKDKEYSNIFLYSTILNLLLSVVIAPIFQAVGIAYVTLATEILFMFSMIFFIQKNELNMFRL